MNATEPAWPSPVKWTVDERAIMSGLYIQPRAAARHVKLSFTVSENVGIARRRYPVRGSLPMHRGELADVSHVRLVDATGKEIPVQAKITGFWPEGSARFVCLDFLADLEARQEIRFTLEYGTGVTGNPKSPLTVGSNDPTKGVDIATGVASFRFTPGTDFLVVKHGKTIFKPITGQAVVCADDIGGSPKRHALHIDQVMVTEQGPVQATVHLTGHYGTDRSPPAVERNEETWRYPVSLFLRIYAGTGYVYVEHGFGYNGEEDKDFVQSYGLTIPTGMVKGKFAYGPDDAGSAEAPLGVRLNQFAHNEWTLSGKAVAKGVRFGGWGAIEDGSERIMVGMREAWQNWPVAISAESTGDLTYEILGEKPDRTLDLRYEDRSKNPVVFHKSHSMYVGDGLSWDYMRDGEDGTPGHSARGLMKIHELFIDFAPAMSPAALTKAFQTSLVPWPGQERFADTKVFGHIGVYGDPKYEHMKECHSAMLEGYPLVHEANGLYGWVDWGDMPMLEGMVNGKPKPFMAGGQGWSNGERALASYFWHYIAGGGARFLDLGRTMVHHTIGMDVDHLGGDDFSGCYLRHNQGHWRFNGSTRQGGFRGWHAYYWLTGDPEVGRLAIDVGIDAGGNNLYMNVMAHVAEPIVGYDWEHCAAHMLAHCCWITTGNWRFARAHHAIATVDADALRQGRLLKSGWVHFRVDKDGEPHDYEITTTNDCAGSGYWLTYGGDDLLVDWASLTGDPVAVDALIDEIRQHRGGGQVYHSAEALYVAAAMLTRDSRLRSMLDVRAARLPYEKAKQLGFKATGTYASLDEWAEIGLCAGKNGFSIVGACPTEHLYWMKADQLIAANPFAQASVPSTVRATEGAKSARVELDGSASRKMTADIVTYEWSIAGKPVATGAKATVDLEPGLHRIDLKVTDAKGEWSTTSGTVTVLPSDIVYQLCFFGGPRGLTEGHRAYDEKAGHGWISGGNVSDDGPSYTNHLRGCGCFLSNHGGNVYQLTVPPGKYQIEMGGGVNWFRSHMNILLQGAVVVPGKKHETNGITWEYAGEVVVGPDGQIKVGIDAFVEDGKLVIDSHGNHAFAFINYLTVKIKK